MTPADAKEIFERGRAAAKSLRLLAAHRSALEAGMASNGIPTAITGGGVSDPTARAAHALIDLTQGWERDEERLRADVEECKALCAGLGIAFRRHQEFRLAMEDRYLLDMPWKQVAAALGCSVSHALSLCDTVCDYIAEVGPAAAKEGLGRAEE